MNIRGSYLGACAIGLLGLAPYVVLSTALLPLQQAITGDLGGGKVGFTLAGGLSSGAYAVGAVVGAQVALRRRQRTIFLVCEPAFVLTTVLSAAAPDMALFALARTLQGLAAGGMLISSLPPLITRFGPTKVPLSAGIVDVGIFGASTLGPIVGLAAAPGGHWRLLLVVAAALGALGWLVALLSYDEWEPADPDRRVDRAALALVVLVAAAVFTASAVGGPAGFGLFLLGVAAFAALLVVERRSSEPLIPLRALSTQLPVSGILAAMIGGAVFVTLVESLETDKVPIGWLWPMPVGAALGAVALWRLFATRWLPLLVDAGICTLGAAALILWAGETRSSVLVASLLLGVGAAATVSPGLFLTGLGLPSNRLGRAFALVQLLRAVATYALAPLLVASSVALPVMAAVSVGGLALLVLIPAVSGARLRAPDIAAWLDGDKGLPSPATATHLRPGVDDEDAEPLLPPGVRDRLRERMHR